MADDRKIVVIVEDNDIQASGLQEFLMEEGFKVVRASDGISGIDVIVNEKPDLIILDISMPNMNGTEMLDRLNEQGWNADTPIIVLTNFSDTEHIHKAMERGAYDYLVKTEWELEDIVAKVKEKLGIDD